MSRGPGGAFGLSQRDQPAGMRRMSRPEGLFQRNNSIHGLKIARLLITSVEVCKNLRQALLLLVVGAKVNRLQIDCFDVGSQFRALDIEDDGWLAAAGFRSKASCRCN